jgi:acyl-CoA thioester hydrolase
MGVVYYGVYPLYYEEGRTEMLRELGLTYADMEKDGILLPVIELNCNYIAPAYYDELLTIRTYLREMPYVRIRFDYDIINPAKKIINRGFTSLVFLNKSTSRPVKAPEYLTSRLEQFF